MYYNQDNTQHTPWDVFQTRFPSKTCLNPFRTAVSFWGQLGTYYSEFEWFVPTTGTAVLKGLRGTQYENGGFRKYLVEKVCICLGACIGRRIQYALSVVEDPIIF